MEKFTAQEVFDFCILFKDEDTELVRYSDVKELEAKLKHYEQSVTSASMDSRYLQDQKTIVDLQTQLIAYQSLSTEPCDVVEMVMKRSDSLLREVTELKLHIDKFKKIRDDWDTDEFTPTEILGEFLDITDQLENKG